MGSTPALWTTLEAAIALVPNSVASANALEKLPRGVRVAAFRQISFEMSVRFLIDGLHYLPAGPNLSARSFHELMIFEFVFKTV